MTQNHVPAQRGTITYQLECQGFASFFEQARYMASLYLKRQGVEGIVPSRGYVICDPMVLNAEPHELTEYVGDIVGARFFYSSPISICVIFDQDSQQRMHVDYFIEATHESRIETIHYLSELCRAPIHVFYVDAHANQFWPVASQHARK